MSKSSTAKVNATSKTTSRKSQKNQEISLSNTVMLDPPETHEEPSSKTNNGVQVIAMPVQTNLQQTSIQETIQLSVLNRLPGNRPIDSSNLQVLGTISASGNRPIFASNMKIWDTMTASGERPIASSNLQFSDTEMIMGNRPIAANDLDGAEDLMGYLD